MKEKLEDILRESMDTTGSSFYLYHKPKEVLQFFSKEMKDTLIFGCFNFLKKEYAVSLHVELKAGLPTYHLVCCRL